MKVQPIFLASILALVLALGLTLRTSCVKMQFSKTVKEAYRTSEGYDQKFIDMVNRLEEVLASRARFGYPGGKDPMTGKERKVVKAAIAPTGQRSEKVTEAAKDPLKLTAIIFDDVEKKYGAIMMDGERSFSVEVGDMIRDRKVQRITEQDVLMEGANTLYLYDIHGNLQTKPKE